MLIEALIDSWTLFSLCCLLIWAPGWPILALRKVHAFKKVKRGTPWKTSLTYLPNWSDFFRAIVASIFFMIWENAYNKTHSSETWTTTGAIFAALVIGTMIQCLFINHKRLIVLPNFYVMGLCLVVSSWDVWLFAVGFTIIIGYKLPDRNILLPIFGLILGIVGYVVGTSLPKLGIGIGVSFIPFTLFMITGRTGIQASTLNGVKSS